MKLVTSPFSGCQSCSDIFFWLAIRHLEIFYALFHFQRPREILKPWERTRKTLNGLNSSSTKKYVLGEKEAFFIDFFGFSFEEI